MIQIKHSSKWHSRLVVFISVILITALIILFFRSISPKHQFKTAIDNEILIVEQVVDRLSRGLQVKTTDEIRSKAETYLMELKNFKIDLTDQEVLDEYAENNVSYNDRAKTATGLRKEFCEYLKSKRVGMTCSEGRCPL